MGQSIFLGGSWYGSACCLREIFLSRDWQGTTTAVRNCMEKIKLMEVCLSGKYHQ